MKKLVIISLTILVFAAATGVVLSCSPTSSTSTPAGSSVTITVNGVGVN